MDIRQFIEDYKEAFGEKAALPIAFWHSDTPVAEPQPAIGCFFPAFEKVRDGQPVSFDDTTMKCGGGKFYCGLAPMPEYVPTFVSEKEHYKASPRLVKDKTLRHIVRYDLWDKYDSRIKQCLRWASPCGWGFPNALNDMYEEMKTQNEQLRKKYRNFKMPIMGDTNS